MIYQFDQFELDTEFFELRKSGAPVAMEPKAFQMLTLLVESRDRVVSQQDMLDVIWGGRIVSDSAVSSVIKLVRRALGDSGEQQRYVRTVRGRGFRFVREVVEAESEATATKKPASEGETPPADRPRTRYARSGDVHVAYQVFGTGPVKLVFAPGFISQIENYWEDPGFNRFLSALGSIAQVAIFDKRGTGLSDTVPDLPPLDERMDDLRAVMDAAGFDRAVIMGISEGGSLASLFAATHPGRVSGLILYGAFARFSSWIATGDQMDRLFDYVRSAWGSGKIVGTFAPSRADDPEFRKWWGQFERLGATPGAVISLMQMNSQIDISGVLPTIRTPTLVIHRSHDTLIDVDAGRMLAAGIPGAQYVELPGADHLLWVGDVDSIFSAIDNFLSARHEEMQPDALLASALVLNWAPEIDDEWRESLKAIIARSGGATLQLNGGGLVAYFTFPARSVRAAAELRDALSNAGVAARGGVHPGELFLTTTGGDGIAVRIAAAIAAAADEGEIRVSRTLKDLVAGAKLTFEPAPSVRLPDMDEDWEVYTLV